MNPDQSMPDYLQLPEGLPVPEDDGAADHLLGITLPSVSLTATSGERVDLSQLPGTSVVFCYPMTGVPGVPLPEHWDDIPGARGCTPQACSYRDNYPRLIKSAARVFGLSTQSTEYQLEFKQRVELPYEILSDAKLEFQQALSIPIFEVNQMKLLKRLTMVIKDGKVIRVNYPVFPSNQDVDWVLEQLESK